jgi:hypothetical protein
MSSIIIFWSEKMNLWGPKQHKKIWLHFFSFLNTFGWISGNREGECRNCKMGSVWRICTFLILPVMYFTILIALLLRCKNSKDYLVAREYSHTSEYALMAFIIYLLYGVDVLTGSYKKVSGRCFLTFCICSVVFFDFWVRMGWPVYLCLFKDSSKMDEFEDRLYSCGAECLRRLQTPSNSSQTPASPPQDLDWILRAIDMAMREASEYKVIMRKRKENHFYIVIFIDALCLNICLVRLKTLRNGEPHKFRVFNK